MTPWDAPLPRSAYWQHITVWPFLLLNFFGVLALPLVYVTWQLPVLILGLLYGLLVGFFQRSLLPTPDHKAWLLGNALAGGLCLCIFITWPPPRGVQMRLAPYVPITYEIAWQGWGALVGFTQGALSSALLGLVQWAMLRRYIPYASRWLLTTMGGWGSLFAVIFWYFWLLAVRD